MLLSSIPKTGLLPCSKDWCIIVGICVTRQFTSLHFASFMFKAPSAEAASDAACLHAVLASAGCTSLLSYKLYSVSFSFVLDTSQNRPLTSAQCTSFPLCGRKGLLSHQLCTMPHSSIQEPIANMQLTSAPHTSPSFCRHKLK